MRRLTIPETVNLIILGKPWTFAACVEHVVDNCPKLNATGAGIRSGARIVEACSKLPTGSTVELRDDDWAVLAEAMETPTAGYHPKLFVQKPDGSAGEPVTIPSRKLLPYIDAVVDARLGIA
jgi:hypothetical protein